MGGSLGGLINEGFLLLTTTAGPMLGALLVVGLMVGLFQAATQINDPALSFLPRLVVILGGCWALGAWMLERYARFFSSALERMAHSGL